MGEFVAVKRRFVVHLRGEDLGEALAHDGSRVHVSGDVTRYPSCVMGVEVWRRI